MEPLLPECYFHIYNRAIGNELLFREDKNYTFFIEKYKQYLTPIADTLAFCLMPNHFHLLICLKPQATIEAQLLSSAKGAKNYPAADCIEKRELFLSKYISKQFSNLFSSYTQAYNLIYNRRGSLFLKNFKRKPVEDDGYLIRLVNYIHRNPVNHGFVSQPQQWKYSSYNAIVSDQPTLIKRDEVLQWFDGLANFKYNHFYLLEL
ncbi:transposase [Sunxiuqinia elliptica]